MGFLLKKLTEKFTLFNRLTLLVLLGFFSLSFNSYGHEVRNLAFSQKFNLDGNVLKSIPEDLKLDMAYFTITSVEVTKIDPEEVQELSHQNPYSFYDFPYAYQDQDNIAVNATEEVAPPKRESRERLREQIEQPRDSERERSVKEKTEDVGAVITIIDKLVALGQKIWSIVESGRPVVNTSMNVPISVIPFDGRNPEAAFFEMERWRVPKTASYRVVYKNGFNKNVISFVYTLTYQYGGQFEGKGQYLTGLTMTASQVDVAWGFNFDAVSSLVAISNMGTKSDQIAGATLKIDYKVRTYFSESQTSELFFVMGDGTSRKL